MTTSHPTLDDIDARLLNRLQDDATLTLQALADELGLSHATCHRRVRRLHEHGWIERQVAIVSADRVRQAQGAGLHALVEVTLDPQTEEAMARFERVAVEHADVQQVWRVSPGPDFMVVIHVPDMPAYQAVARQLFTAAHGVRTVRAFFALHRAKFSARQEVRARSPQAT